MRPEREDLRRCERVRKNVAVREHRALRLPGRPRGEDDFGERVSGERSLGERLLVAGEVGEELHLVQRDTKGARPLQRLLRDDRGTRFGALGDALGKVDQRVHVERHEDRAEPQRRQKSDPVLGTVGAPDHHAVARSETRVGEMSCDPRHDVGEVAVRPRPRAEARSDDQRRLPVVLARGFLEDVVERLHSWGAMPPKPPSSRYVTSARSAARASSRYGG